MRSSEVKASSGRSSDYLHKDIHFQHGFDLHPCVLAGVLPEDFLVILSDDDEVRSHSKNNFSGVSVKKKFNSLTFGY
jgi:hypothetical protein